VIIRDVQPIGSLDDGEPYGATVRVWLVDKDPLSRYFLTNALREMRGVEVDLSPGDVSEYLPPAHMQVVLIASTPSDPALLSQLRALTATTVRVLMLGVEWTPEYLRDALAAGVAGCVIKSADVAALRAALHAVASGHIVISPELLDGYLATPEPVATGSADIVHKLTTREIEVLGLLAQGMSTSEVATRLVVSTATVKSHISHVLTKLGVRSRVQAVLIAKELGLHDPGRWRGSDGAGPSPSPGPEQTRLPGYLGRPFRR
jgi:two-component system, NarL family, nitrate/nitrite response regulator NarL